eukprot:1157025-Pelagomonas_calceolata.AAC.3
MFPSSLPPQERLVYYGLPSSLQCRAFFVTFSQDIAVSHEGRAKMVLEGSENQKDEGGQE